MTRRRVVTEREILRASRAGEQTLDVAGALVTPSARDAARRAKIALSGLVERPAPARAPGRSIPEQPDPAETARRDARRAAREGPRKSGSRRGQPATAAAAKPGAVGATAGAVTASAPSAGSPRERPARHASQQNPERAEKPDPTGTSEGRALTVALGADHGGVSLKSAVADRIRELGLAVLDFGTVTKDPVDYPDFAVAVAKAVASGRATVGVMIDGAGIGSCMAANKVAGVRAAMCYDVTTATNAREHNNANVLTLGAGLIGPRLALAILETFLATPFAGGRHGARVQKIDALDGRG